MLLAAESSEHKATWGFLPGFGLQASAIVWIAWMALTSFVIGVVQRRS